MWRPTVALIALALIGLIAYNLGGRLLPASAGVLAVFDVNAAIDEPDADLANPACETASGDCTLRAAIEQANFATKTECTPCTITFDSSVFPPGAPAVIQVDSELPDIEVLLTIDATGAGVIIEPALGVAAFCGLCVLDDTPANPTDFTINGGGAFTIREFLFGIIICGDDGVGGGCGSGPVQGINLNGLDIDSSGFAGVGIFGQDGVTNVNVSDTNVSNSGGDGFLINNLDGPIDGITFDSVTITNNSGPGINIFSSAGPVRGITFSNVESSSNGGDGINIESDESVFDIFWEEGLVDSNGGAGIRILYVVDANGFIFEFGRFSNNGGDGISIRSPGAADDIIFDNIESSSNNGSGIKIDTGGAGGMVSNSTFSDNGGDGLFFFGTKDNSLFYDVILNRFIDNSGPAVNITDISGVTVSNNVMTGNGAGVVVAGSAGRVTISQNSMAGNFGLGIDLGGDGVTPNDPGDADTGPNGLQNFPVILDINTTTRIVTGEAPPFSTVELFLTEDPPDPSGFGEGFIFADGFESGDTTAWGAPFSRAGRTSTGSSGTFGITLGAFPCGLPAGSLTATATDANGNTSEFSANLPGFPGTESCPADKDGDGCTDAQELGLDENLGGRRDPNYFWDFFDPNRDGAVTLLDFLAVLRHFGAVSVPPPTKEEALAEALLPEPPIGEYWALADRGGQAPGGNPWDDLPPNGSIGLADFLSALRQFGHTCA